MGIAIGILPHTGWAWLVRVAGSRKAKVESRARIVACEVVEGQLYHLAADSTRGRLEFAERRMAVVTKASFALAPHLGEVRAAVVLGKRLVLPSLEIIVAAHTLIHGAEGELWRAVFAEACATHGLSVTRATARDVATALAKRHPSQEIATFLAEGKRDVGPPWSREPQEAALGAWSVL